MYRTDLTRRAMYPRFCRFGLWLRHWRRRESSTTASFCVSTAQSGENGNGGPFFIWTLQLVHSHLVGKPTILPFRSFEANHAGFLPEGATIILGACHSLALIPLGPGRPSIAAAYDFNRWKGTAKNPSLQPPATPVVEPNHPGESPSFFASPKCTLDVARPLTSQAHGSVPLPPFLRIRLWAVGRVAIWYLSWSLPSVLA
jgi:hypothetical protein